MPVHDASSAMGGSAAALGQVLVDCVLFDALFISLMLLSSAAVEGGRTMPTRADFLPAIAAGWRVNACVLPVEYVLFRRFPLRLRALGMNVVDLAWEAVMSFVVHGGSAGEAGGGRGDPDTGSRASPPARRTTGVDECPAKPKRS